ncbi:MAG: glycosyltransferase family 2 protein [Acidimicrobiia bacterium]
MSTEVPRVTVGIPVYNGGLSIRATIESVLAQTYDSFEVLVVDNASTDDTEEVCRELAARDDRVRYVRNTENIGQNNNFTRVYQLGTGDFFRWMGDDDSLEPGYLTACVEALDSDPTASLVSTYQSHIKPDGTEIYEEYTGPRPDSTDPVNRLHALLKLMNGSRYWIDPVYTLARRAAMPSDTPIRTLRFGDQILAAELALAGPYLHVPVLLAHRSWAPLPQGRRATAQYAGGGEQGIRPLVVSSSQRLLMLNVLIGDVWASSQLSIGGKLRGTWVVLLYGLRTAVLRVTRFVTKRVRLARGHEGSVD